MSVVVVGSANLDLVYRVERIPAAGRDGARAGSRHSAPGGKGNNQVTAAARAGAAAAFIAALGTDAAGDRLVGQPRQQRACACTSGASTRRPAPP